MLNASKKKLKNLELRIKNGEDPNSQNIIHNSATKTKGFGGPWRVGLTTLGIFILSQVIAAVFTIIILGVTGADTSFDTSNAAQFIYVLIAEGLAAASVLLVLKERGLKLKAIGLGRRPQWRDLKRAAIGFVAFYGLLIVAGMLINIFVPSINNQEQDVGFNALNSLSDSILAFIALVILPPLGEEVLVRGYLFSGLRSTWRLWPALLVTSGLFGLAHLSGGDSGLLWTGAIDTFLLSAVLVYLRENTSALYAGMLVHMLNNVIAFGVHFK